VWGGGVCEPWAGHRRERGGGVVAGDYSRLILSQVRHHSSLVTLALFNYKFLSLRDWKENSEPPNPELGKIH